MNYNIIDLPHRPLLSSEETRDLIISAQQGDNQALEKVVEHNLKLILKIIHRFKNTGYELQDLFQIGVIGLIKAVNNFDLNKNNRFSTYAFSRIMGEIRLHLRDDGMIRVSRSLKKIAREISNVEEEFKKNYGYPPTINELSEKTGYKTEEIVEAMDAEKKPASLSQPIKNQEGSKMDLSDCLSFAEQGIDNEKLALVEVIRELDYRDKKIIYFRYFKDMTQQEVAEEIGVSQVQISRLEKKIIKELKTRF